MKFEQILENYKNENEGNALIEYVVDDILSKESGYHQGYLNDVLKNGCISGTVTSLIYYSDTDAFFIKYHYEIFDLINEYKEEVGEIPSFEEWSSNSLAWFGYEQTVYNLSCYLEDYDITDEDDEEGIV